MKRSRKLWLKFSLLLLLLLGGCVYAKLDNVLDNLQGIIIQINIGACRFNADRFGSGCVFR